MAPAVCLGWLLPPSPWNCSVVYHRWEWLGLSRKAPEMDVAEGWGLFLLASASLPKNPPWLESGDAPSDGDLHSHGDEAVPRQTGLLSTHTFA